MIHMDFIWSSLQAIKKVHLKLTPRISNADANLKTNNINQSQSAFERYDPEKALSFLIKQFKEQTKLPIIIFYAPHLPVIINDKIDYTDCKKPTVNLFATICKRNNIDFIDLSEKFIKLHRNRGKFARGFFNSEPGKGHFNKLGHELIAKEIFHYLKHQNLITRDNVLY